jgi:hypothetical protein
MIHVRVCEKRSNATKTQGNLVYSGFSKCHSDEDTTTTLIFRVGDLVVMEKRSLHTHTCTFPPLPLAISPDKTFEEFVYFTTRNPHEILRKCEGVL